MHARTVGLLALALLLSATGSGRAQFAQPSSPPPSGFVSPYAIMYTLRSAGFYPLAPPLREGATYAARAADDRGTLVRVVLDARTGAIRDVTRIMPGPGAYGGGPGVYRGGPGPYEGRPRYGGGPYGDVGMLPPPDDGPQPYGEGPEFDASEAPPGEEEMVPRSVLPGPPHPAARPTVTILLPRPRPTMLASHPADAAKPELTSNDAPSATRDAKPAATDQKPEAKADVTSTVAPAAPIPVKPGKAPAGPPIND
jgi:hypothetical protein